MSIIWYTFAFTADCYREVGEHYKGQVGVTESGFQCQPWSSQAPHRHKLNPAIIPGLRMNHCRNPGGLKEKPWCYTSNATVDWEYCNVPICGECIGTEGRRPSVHGCHWSCYSVLSNNKIMLLTLTIFYEFMKDCRSLIQFLFGRVDDFF